ncbi:MAG: hypothetical protein KGJ13_05220 [Patescibacteria group bacterium]|nr:hypothetical protein [Patescibacteria group bacterium]
MRVEIVTAHDGSLNFSGIAEKSYGEYASRHGYGMITEKFEKSGNGAGHPSWQKLALLQRMIHGTEADWLMWVDTDSLVTNHTTAIDGIINDYNGDDIFLVVSRDWSDDSPWSAGVMLIKVCATALAFLMVSQKYTRFMDSGCWDQSAMHEVWRTHERFTDGIRILPRRVLQSVPRECSSGVLAPWQRGDFIAHATGVPNEVKHRIMEKLVSQVTR